MTPRLFSRISEALPTISGIAFGSATLLLPKAASMFIFVTNCRAPSLQWG